MSQITNRKPTAENVLAERTTTQHQWLIQRAFRQFTEKFRAAQDTLSASE